MEHKEMYSELRGLIRARFKTQELMARAIGRSACSVSKKLNGKAEWTAQDIRRACAVLDIPPQDIPRYFF